MDLSCCYTAELAFIIIYNVIVILDPPLGSAEKSTKKKILQPGTKWRYILMFCVADT